MGIRIRLGAVAAILALALIATGCAGTPGSSGAAAPTGSDAETLFQTSTLSALIDGLYQSATTVGALKKQGDTGIGTFEALDGEMVEVDGIVYQVKADGTVAKPSDQTGSPFAAVTTFHADKTLETTAVASFDALKKQIDAQLDGVNEIRVIRIEGHFDYVKTRSVPRQTEPYKPLLEVTAKQPEFEFRDVDGVMVGLWFPAWIGQINMPGYHLHFLTADRTGGGHLLDVSAARLTVQIDDTPRFDLALPNTEAFRTTDLAGDYQKQMKAAEQ